MSDPIEELKKELRVSTSKITDSVNDLGVQIGSLDTSIRNVEKTLDKHDERITENRDGQLLATRGVEVLNRETRDAKKAIAKKMTANPGTAPIAFEDKTNKTVLKNLFKSYGHYLLIALFMLGYYLGSGGDKEETLRFSSQVLRRLDKIEQIKTEPIRVPVPVSSECISEEE